MESINNLNVKYFCILNIISYSNLWNGPQISDLF